MHHQYLRLKLCYGTGSMPTEIYRLPADLKADINVTVKAGNTSAGWALSAAYGAGIQAGNQIVDSVIGNNITVTVNGSPNRVDCPASGYGVIAYEGILNTRFENDIKVTVTTSSSGSRSQAAGYGIYAQERTFGNAAQQASVNNITVTVTGSGVNETDIPSIAYGIYAGYINLEVNGKISATVNGKKGYAIYIDNPGDISDTLTLRRGANLDGIVELAKGNNVVYCYGGALRHRQYPGHRRHYQPVPRFRKLQRRNQRGQCSRYR